MRKKLIILTLFSAIILSSCGKSKPIEELTPEPTATIEPTPEPTIEPTESPEPPEPQDNTEVEDEVYDSMEDVVAEHSDMDAVINSYDDNLAEEVTDPVEGVVVDYEVIPVTPMTLYATKTVNLRQGPSADDFAKIGSLSARQQVTVIGEVREYKGKSVYWWQLDTGEFVSAAYLSEKPIPESSTGTGTGNSSTTGGSSTTEQVPETPAPGTQMPGGFIWIGGGGELPSAGSEYSGIEWE